MGMNIPGMMGGGHMYLDETDVISAQTGDQNIPLPPTISGPSTSIPPIYVDIFRELTANNPAYADMSSGEIAQILSSDPQGLALVEATYKSNLADLNRSIAGDTGGSGDAVAYAQLAQRAKEFEEEKRMRQAESIQANRLAQQQAQQEYYANIEAANQARRQQNIDAASSAMNAFTSNVGSANIPGIENYNPFAGDVAPSLPVYRLDPSRALGRNLPAANIPMPNIPDMVY